MLCHAQFDMLSFFQLELAPSKLTASLCLQSLSCCSTDAHTACTQVKDHESCFTSLGKEQEAWMVPGPACVLQVIPSLAALASLVLHTLYS